MAGIALLTWVRPAAGVTLLFVAVSADVVRPVVGGIQVSASELEGACCLLGWILRGEWEEIQWRPLKWSLPFLLVVAFSGLFTTAWYKVPPHLLRLSELFVMMALAATVFKPGRGERLFQVGLLAAGIAYPVIGFFQINDSKVFAIRIYSTFGNPNQFAGYLNLLLPFAAALFFSSREQKIRPVWAYFFLLMAAALLLTESRAGLLGLAGSLTVMVLLYYRRPFRRFLAQPRPHFTRFVRRKGPVLLLHLCALLALGIFVQSRWGVNQELVKLSRGAHFRWEQTEEEGLVNRVRFALFRLGWELWKENPILGLGPGNYQEAIQSHLPLWKKDPRMAPILKLAGAIDVDVHNLWLQLAVDFGVLAPFCFLVFIVSLFNSLLDRWRQSPFALAGFGLLAAFLIQNLVDVTYPSLGLEMGLLLGVALGLGASVEGPSIQEV